MVQTKRLTRRALMGSSALLLAGRALPAFARSGFPSSKFGEVLPDLKQDHPRLLITDGALNTMRAAAKGDPLFAQLIEHILTDARAILTRPHVPFRLTGAERPSMLGGSRQIIHYIMTCAFAWRWTGERAFAERAVAEMTSAARFPEWNHTHFLDVAETAFGVAVGYDWLHGFMDEDTRDLVRTALVEKCLLWADRAYRGSKDPWLGFPAYTWNWNQVCNGGALAAAMAVAESEALLCADVIAGAVRSVPLALTSYEPDGISAEGPVYWTYGTTYHVIILAMLEVGFGNDRGLAKSAGFQVTDTFRLWAQGPTGKAFNYADCHEKLAPSPALAYLGQRFGHPASVERARQDLLELIRSAKLDGEFDRFLPLYTLWYPQAVAAKPDTQKARHFRGEADLAIFRSGWAPGDVYLGFKGGNNAANHAHHDLGSFVLDSQGVRWAIDLGSDSYQVPGYFDSGPEGKRFNIYRISAKGHGTIMPEGGKQSPEGLAPISRFREREDGGMAVLDLTKAYPGAAQSLQRGVDFLADGQHIVIRDEIRAGRPDQIWRWAMFTRATITLHGNRATLTQEGKAMQAVIDTPGHVFEVLSAAPDHPGEADNKDVSILAIRAQPQATGDLDLTVSLYPTKHGARRAGSGKSLSLWN
ncbi:hypothetical protein FHW96_004620 [Novosphingobium sp. SG751A]|uniref:heparinase II/III domain-containing protein n=1 Tax=Novosphingobium sp. SG751A TaxID=2587000 RepID=UPI0015522FAC|nr:heparinase II/III family protein [Novosphingobium sp. SG751A]NOW48432.1 hypothetical protein [Novosphingobium sp. SG751A]